jgi:serralysin
VDVLDQAAQPTPNDLKLVLGTGHGADEDTVLVVGAGRRGRVLSSFEAFGGGYDGGVNVAAGNVAGSNEDEIVAVQADSIDGSVSVRLFQRVDELFGEIIWLPLPSLTAFRPGDKIELGQVDIVADGANVAVGNLVGDDYAEIVVAPASGTPMVRVLRPTGTIFAEWLAYFSDEDGISVALGDLNGDSNPEIVTAPGSGMPRIRVFKPNGSVFLDPDSGSEVSFFAFDQSFNAGLRVAVADVDLDGRGEIIVGTGPGVTAEIRAYEMDGSLVAGWEGRRPLGPASDRGVVLAATDRFLRH